jgi:hypothetical protein
MEQGGRMLDRRFVGGVQAEVAGGEVRAPVSVEVGAGEAVPPATAAGNESCLDGLVGELAVRFVAKVTDEIPLERDDEIRSAVLIDVAKQRAPVTTCRVLSWWGKGVIVS